MTYDEVTLFRNFMRSKGILNNFEYLYDHHKFSNKTIDKYYDSVMAEDVILSAFDFSGTANTIYNFKYWKDMHAKWMIKLNEFRKTGKTEISTVLCPQCKRSLPESAFAFKTNGLRHKHCMECESGEFARKKKQDRLRRAENEKEILSIVQAKTTKVCGHCGQRKPLDDFYPDADSEDGKQDWCRKCQEELSSISDDCDTNNGITDEDSVLSPDSKSTLYAPKLGEYDATLHLYKLARNCIVFNSVLSSQIFAANYTKCYVNSDRQNRVFLIFNHHSGHNITRKKFKNELAAVNSVDICRLLVEKFKLTYENTYYLHISRNLAAKNDLITIEILQVRTSQEYYSIALRKENNISKGYVKSTGQNDEKPEKPHNEKVSVPHTQASQKLSADSLIKQLIDDGTVTEKDLASFLFTKGWKLQKPTTVYEEFNL